MSVGMLLIGVGLMSVAGIGAALYYLPHTTLTTAGMFLLADVIAGQRGPVGDWFLPAPPVPWILPGVLFFMGAVAAAGMPPLSGFIGKLLLLKAVPPDAAGWLWTVVITGSLAGLVALSRAGTRLFWRTEGETLSRPAYPLTRIAPVVVLLAMSVVLTIFAAPICRYAEATAIQLLTPQDYIAAVLQKEKTL
jgi:multicomponent K+:H+ antiporter subunit D